MLRPIFRSDRIVAVFFFAAISLVPVFAHADTSAFSFRNNLSLWDLSSDVQSLQQFLNAQGFLVSRSGAGSPGHETSLFGLLTYHALVRYQAAHDLPATGYFGPMTRALLSQSAANTNTSSGQPTTTQTNPPTTSVATSSQSAQSTMLTSSIVAPLSFGGGGLGGGGSSAAAAPSCSLSASSPTITLSNSSSLSWSSTNASSASLSGTGSVAISGSQNVTPNTTTTYILTVTNSAGATGSCTATVTVIGSGDTTPPTVSLTAPANGATVSGAAVPLSATASDNVAVADVQFKVGNTNIGSAILSSPYTTSWNTTLGTSTPDGTYTLNAVAADTSGNLATSSVSVTVRNAPPVISSIASSTSYTSATTTWTTDEAANSNVVYGLTTSYGSASSSPSFATSHSIILSGLTASSTYHFAVVSTDAGGNTSTSTDQTLTTLATSTPPVLSAISSGTPTTTAATITWTTDQSSNSKVVWGTTTSYGSSSSTASFVTSHSIILSGLATSTTYHYAVVSANTFGATATSSDQTFTTLSGVPDTTPPTMPTNLVATPVSSSQINLSWTASNDNGGGDSCCSYKIYRDGTQVGTTTSGTTYNDTGLSPSTLHSYWIAAYDPAGNVSTTTGTTVAVTQTGPDAYGTTWHELKIGAGGLISGIDIAPDGTKVIRTDTFGGYLWTGTLWQQLITSESTPAGDVALNGQGVYEIQIAPGDTNRFYMMFNGYVYRSDNKGVTWTKTGFSQVSANPNDNTKGFGPFIAIDPANADVAYAGTPSNGLWVTSNAGTSWSQVSAIALATSTGLQQGGGDDIAFDPTSSVVGGRTQGIYATSYGTGVYHSTDGGQTWTLTSGTPTLPGHMVVAQDGVVYVTNNDGSSNLYKYSSGAWSTVNVGGAPVNVAVDPANANRIVVSEGGGSLSVSSNHGASFTGYPASMSFTATDIPWLAWALNAQQYMSSGNIAFDPTASSTLYESAGVGVWVTVPTNADTSITWNSQSLGIEQLVANQIISPPGYQPIAGSWDRPVFDVSDPDVLPSTYEPSNAVGIDMGWALDYASNNPDYVAGILNWNGADQSGYSMNGGQTWNAFGSLPANLDTNGKIGGGIAVASSTNILWFPANNSAPYYTLDGGNTWNQISMPGVPTSGETGWSSNYAFNRHIVTADRINIGTFYAYNYGPTGDSSAAGVYKSTNSGVTWTQVYSGQITNFSNFNAKLKAVPGKAGELFFTGGLQSAFPSEQFMHSTDGGTTWNAVPNVTEVIDFGFGQAKAGTTTPAIFIDGWVNSTYGIWESDDDAQTWTQIGQWPLGSLDAIQTITGDMNTYGRVYIGFQGSGYAYGDTSNAAPSVTFTAPAAGATVSGSSVTLSATSSGSVAIANVQFEVDGTDIGSAISSPPYTTTWNTTGVSNSAHTLYAVARGTSGTYATSSIAISVDNTVPVISNISSTTTVAGATVTWTTNDNSNSEVVYGLTSSYGSASSSATFVTSHSVIFSGLTASTTYHFAVVSANLAGNTATSSDQTFTTAAAGPNGLGAGDVIPGAVAWWGLRCYNSSYSGNVADVWDSATGSTTETLLTCSPNGVVNQTINNLATTCASGCSVKTLYDQSGANSCGGAACNLTQASTSSRPTFTQNCLGGRACMTFNGSQDFLISGLANPLFSQPYVVSSVAERTGSPFAYDTIFDADGGFAEEIFNAAANTVGISSPNLVTAPATDNAFHAIQGEFNSTNSSIMVDGTTTAGLNAGSNTINTSMTVGGDNFLNGQVGEVGIWNSALSSTTLNALNSNQHTYWSF